MSRARAETLQLTRQGVQYLLVGAMAAVTDLGVYSLLHVTTNLHPLQANLISRPLGGIVSFTLNKYWTFGNRRGAAIPVQFFRFSCVWTVCFAGSEALVGLYHEGLRLGAVPAKLAAEATLALFSFLSQRYWTFR